MLICDREREAHRGRGSPARWWRVAPAARRVGGLPRHALRPRAAQHAAGLPLHAARPGGRVRPAGTRFEVAELDSEDSVERLTAWFTARWGGRAAATFNRHLDALRSAAAFWAGQGWLTTDPARRLRRRGRAPDRNRAIAAGTIEAMLGMDVPIREKTLWTMLYETAARSSEVLALDVEDLDRRNRRSRVTRKGSAVDIIVWQTGTARLLPRLLDGRTRGPVFLRPGAPASPWPPPTWTPPPGGLACPTGEPRRSSTS